MITLLNSGVLHFFYSSFFLLRWQYFGGFGAWRNLSGDYQDVGRRGCQVGGLAVPARHRWPLGVQRTRMRGWWRLDVGCLNVFFLSCGYKDLVSFFDNHESARDGRRYSTWLWLWSQVICKRICSAGWSSWKSLCMKLILKCRSICILDIILPYFKPSKQPKLFKSVGIPGLTTIKYDPFWESLSIHQQAQLWVIIQNETTLDARDSAGL